MVYRLSFLAKEKVSLRFWDDVLVIDYTEAATVSPKTLPSLQIHTNVLLAKG